MGRIALLFYALFIVLAFGLRTFIQWRRTGSTGVKGVSGKPGSLEWLGGALFVVSLVGGVAAPALDIAGVLSPVRSLDVPLVQGFGCLLFAIGLVATLFSQFLMGDSWRIGVDFSERTTLVTGGPFAYVRNPIFTSMLVASTGLVLVVPNIVALLAFAGLLGAIEIQVRAVEEPYLLGTQGAAYASYARRVGRFVPGCGVLDKVGDANGTMLQKPEGS
jgi:protein-S-isoprenylcysteine O-methyltransferase Ste14